MSFNGIIDEKVYDIEKNQDAKESLALTKDDFAGLIYGSDKYADGFDFNSFKKIFAVIREICSEIKNKETNTNL